MSGLGAKDLNCSSNGLGHVWVIQMKSEQVRCISRRLNGGTGFPVVFML